MKKLTSIIMAMCVGYDCDGGNYLYVSDALRHNYRRVPFDAVGNNNMVIVDIVAE